MVGSWWLLDNFFCLVIFILLSTFSIKGMHLTLKIAKKKKLTKLKQKNISRAFFSCHFVIILTQK